MMFSINNILRTLFKRESKITFQKYFHKEIIGMIQIREIFHTTYVCFIIQNMFFMNNNLYAFLMDLKKKHEQKNVDLSRVFQQTIRKTLVYRYIT